MNIGAAGIILILAASLRAQEDFAAAATSRCPSARFNKEELDAALAAEKKLNWGVSFPNARPWAEVPPGFREFCLRFAPSASKVGLLEWLRAHPREVAADAGTVRISLFDRDPVIRTLAAHVLLDAGAKVDPAELRNPSLLGPLLRLGDAAAAVEIRKLLEPGGDLARYRPYERLKAAVDHAAYGTRDLLPLVKPFLPVTRGAFAWARLGGPMEDLAPWLDGRADSCIWDELIEAGTPEAFKVVEERIPHSADDWSLISRVLRLREYGREQQASRLLERIANPTNGFVATLGPRLTLVLAASGRDAAMKELLGLKWTEASLDAVRGAAGELFAGGSDPRVVDVLVAALIAARAGVRDDCTGVGPGYVIATSKMLSRRGDADRARALRQLEEAFARRPDRATDLWVRWTLGVRPPAESLSHLSHSEFALECGLSLRPCAAEYAAAVPALLRDVRANWFALALLGEEAAIDPLGAWLEDAIEKNEGGWRSRRPRFK